MKILLVVLSVDLVLNKTLVLNVLKIKHPRKPKPTKSVLHEAVKL